MRCLHFKNFQTQQCLQKYYTTNMFVMFCIVQVRLVHGDLFHKYLKLDKTLLGVCRLVRISQHRNIY